jgi:hypothetical protein
VTPPEVDGAVIKRLGTPAFWDAGESFAAIMTQYYREISRKAIEAAYRDHKNPEEAEAPAAAAKKPGKKKASS